MKRQINHINKFVAAAEGVPSVEDAAMEKDNIWATMLVATTTLTRINIQ